ncbi:hypothetical protein [Chamaesiphon polymorphus]|nr:hypothetical protein [Chamaesiphon polymorphus]
MTQNELPYAQMEVWHRQQLTELANRYPQLNNLQIIGTIIAIDINYR